MVYKTAKRRSYVTLYDWNLDMSHTKICMAIDFVFREHPGAFYITFADFKVVWQRFVVELIELIIHAFRKPSNFF